MSTLPPVRIPGSLALVTGAAGGMGEHLAYGLSARGAGLIMVDRDEVGLSRVAAELARRRPDLEVETMVVDLAESRSAQTMIDTIRDKHPQLNLIFNNAGVAMAGRFDELSETEFDWLLEINLRAPIRIIRGLLPLLRVNAENGSSAHIVNTSSVFGLLAPYGQSAYSTSKFGLRGFSESLGHELSGRGIGVTCVLPGGIRTNIAKNARIAATIDAASTGKQISTFDRALRYPADRAADNIIEAMIKRRPRLLIGPDAQLLSAVTRLSPTGFGRILSVIGQRGARSVR